jgi:hypothetical protein
MQDELVSYLVISLAILCYGLLRSRNDLQKRRLAKTALNRARQGLFQYCPIEHWPKSDLPAQPAGKRWFNRRSRQLHW